MNKKRLQELAGIRHLNENLSKIIENFEGGLRVYIMDTYQRLDDNEAELLDLDELYDSINYILEVTEEEDWEENEKEEVEFFLNNRSQIEHYLIDNINTPIEVQWPGLSDVFYYTSLVKKNQIWIKLGTTPDSKLNSKYNYYNPSDDLEFPIRIKNKEDFEKYSKELEAKGYHWGEGRVPSSFNPAEDTKGGRYPFRLYKWISTDINNLKQLTYNF